eukprot:GGOE01004565.1.p1 GENE.GGOE01004565.1~~GGOE01004565.1.p1  ORF type:complete len:338 (+),score=133.19 GGOE01004565.1:62-1075(+)
MVLEATFICIDNSEYMRNGDLSPTRVAAVLEASNLVVGAKTQSHPESTVGLLTMAGKGVQLYETLTNSLGRILAALSTVTVSGDLHFIEGIQIAALGLKHRQNKQQRQRIIAFVGSPIREVEKELTALGKKLKKNSVAVDIVAFGVDENIPKLEAFINAVNSQENSHLINVPLGVMLADVLVSSPLIAEEGMLAMGGGGGDFEFGVDPAQDPDLAMVLRMSMEEERRRQEAEQKAKAEQERATGGETSMAMAVEGPKMEELTEEQQLEMALRMSMGDAEMTEEEEIERALKMSMNVDMEPGVDELMQDEAYMAQLAQSIAGIKPEEKKPEEKKPEDK